MVQIDVITGFLGAGKTTFIKKYVYYLNHKNQKVGIIENDYGAINIDTLILSSMQSELCDIEMVVGGDIDSLKRRLKTKLISMAMLGYQRIILEPSGIFDIDLLMDLLYESPLDAWYELGNVISIVDARLANQSLSSHSLYILASELTKAGSIVMSKTQLATSEEIQNTNLLLQQSLQQIECKRVIQSVEEKAWDEYCEEDFIRIENSSYMNYSYVKHHHLDDLSFESLFFMNQKKSIESIQSIASDLISNPIYGNIIRLKGFIEQEHHWFEFNFTKEESTIHPIDQGQLVFIVIGENLNQKEIEERIHVSN